MYDGLHFVQTSMLVWWLRDGLIRVQNEEGVGTRMLYKLDQACRDARSSSPQDGLDGYLKHDHAEV